MMTSPLPSDLSAAAAARDLIRRSLVEWGLSDILDDAELVVSELVANAVRHGAMPISLSAYVQDGSLHVAVEDGDPTRVPVQREAGPDATNGRGLLLISALSRRWGCTAGASSKIVWAELDGRAATP